MNKETKKKIKQLHQNQLTFQEMADYLNIPLAKVEHACTAKRGREPIEEWRIQKIKQLVLQGEKDSVIGKQLNVSVSTVIKYSKEERHQYKQQHHKYEMVAPDGTVHKIVNLVEFCAEQDLNYYSVRRVIEGYAKSNKGWTVHNWSKGN